MRILEREVDDELLDGCANFANKVTNASAYEII
jgi:hypothetical protein